MATPTEINMGNLSGKWVIVRLPLYAYFWDLVIDYWQDRSLSTDPDAGLKIVGEAAVSKHTKVTVLTKLLSPARN